VDEVLLFKNVVGCAHVYAVGSPTIAAAELIADEAGVQVPS
jgi:hypothetical protein